MSPAISVLCIVCHTIEESAFDEPDGLFCVECETRYAWCVECDQVYPVAEATSTMRCDLCLVDQAVIRERAA